MHFAPRRSALQRQTEFGLFRLPLGWEKDPFIFREATRKGRRVNGFFYARKSVLCLGGIVIYGSVCSGIEAASVAWEPLGFTPAWFSEIEPFPSAVLAHRFPTVENRGDMTKYKEWKDGSIRFGVIRKSANGSMDSLTTGRKYRDADIRSINVQTDRDTRLAVTVWRFRL